MKRCVITLAGDSGDGIQLLGNVFSDAVALESLELNTMPDFPAEIRAPAGTVHGVSGFQIQFGADDIFTAGNKSDVFIAFNAAGLKKYFKTLKPTGVLIYDPAGFDAKNCKLAQFDMDQFDTISNRKISVEFSKLTKEALLGFDIEEKDKDKNKNIFALGLLSFGLHTTTQKIETILNSKFKAQDLEILLHVLNKGIHYGETIEFSLESMELNTEKRIGSFKNISGNKAISLAILSLPKLLGRKVFFGGYPITPASDILHELSKHSFEEIIVRQAEDEIAAAAMALGASFGGNIGITASSGPGIDLKQEVIGLAHMAEIPLLIIDVQRAGPSTGMPTKVEQSDLNLALKGRHGDCPVPVVAISSPAKAFEKTIEAVSMAIEFQTPVFLLSDAMIANSSELWEIPEIIPREIEMTTSDHPYHRSDKKVRPWIELGKEGINYIAGGLEKDKINGIISYDGENHETMTRIRLEKIQGIAKRISPVALEANSCEKGTIIVSWGSTYGAVHEAFTTLRANERPLAHIHLDWVFPFASNFLNILSNYDQIIVPELNHGQFAKYLAEYTSKPIHRINKLQGMPFFGEELADNIISIMDKHISS